MGKTVVLLMMRNWVGAMLAVSNAYFKMMWVRGVAYNVEKHRW